MINKCMNYKIHYDRLISRAKTRTLTGYKESHHVIPKCMGGLDVADNIVDLTAAEHFIAHLLLVKMFPTNKKLIYAANMLTVGSGTQQRSNKRYAWLKQKYVEVCRDRTGEQSSCYGKSWYYNLTTGQCKKFVSGTEPEGYVKGRLPPKLCKGCEVVLDSKLAQWCSECRPKREQTVFKSPKEKVAYTDTDKMNALAKCNGNIRQALFSLGLNDSGPHYKRMKELKALVYPPATNGLKG